MNFNITLDGLEETIARIVDERLGGQVVDDPWLDSKAAAEYLGVKRQRIHDLTSTGLLPRCGEPGERLYFRRSILDAYREGLRS